MAEPKTRPTDASVADFINAQPAAQARQDCWQIVEIMQQAAQAEPVMWGAAIVGFGKYRATNPNGKGNDWPLVGFSPRKQALTLYLMLGGQPQAEALLSRLGKYTRGKGCLYIKRLADVDASVLHELVQMAVEYVRSHTPA